MASRVFLTLGERTIMVSRPATYQDLMSEIRSHFPDVSAVYSLVVLFQPATDGRLLENWVQVAPSAYSHVHDGAELFVNVVHPLTKEYILPLPGQPVPNLRCRKQVRRTNGDGNRVGDEPGDYDATAQDNQVSKTRPRGVSGGARRISHKFHDYSVSLELERPGGDPFVSNWAGASERFRRSTKLVPNLKDCKEAVGQTVGQSNFYPDDEVEKIADIKLGTYQDRDRDRDQDQGLQATEAGWYTGAEPAQRGENPGHTEAQHLAGGLEEDQHQGKQADRFHSNDSHHNWFAVSHSPQHFPGTLPESHRRSASPMTPQWGYHNAAEYAWGGYRTPLPGGRLHRQGRNNVPEYVQSGCCSPIDGYPVGVGGWDQEGNPGGWNDDVADQAYSRTVAGSGDHAEVGHLTNAIHTNGVTTNGNLTNGHQAAHSEVSQHPQHQDQRYGASDWSPPCHQSTGYYRPQDFRFRSHPPGEPGSKAFAGPRPRRDPAEVTYGSPRPRIQGSNSGWTTIGRKKNTWTNIPLQEQCDPERAQPNVDNNDHAWYAQMPPPHNLHGTAGHGRDLGDRHSRFVGNDIDRFRQKQRSGPEMSWGADFWGGPPPNRTQRGAFTHHDTPASNHWQ